jgi:hypothetical protein
MTLRCTVSPASTFLAAVLAFLGLVSSAMPPRAAAAEPAPASSPHVVSIDVGEEDASTTTPRPGVLGFVTESTGFVVTAYAPLVDATTGRLADSFRIRPRGERRSAARPPASSASSRPSGSPSSRSRMRTISSLPDSAAAQHPNREHHFLLPPERTGPTLERSPER